MSIKKRISHKTLTAAFMTGNSEQMKVTLRYYILVSLFAINSGCGARSRQDIQHGLLNGAQSEDAFRAVDVDCEKILWTFHYSEVSEITRDKDRYKAIARLISYLSNPADLIDGDESLVSPKQVIAYQIAATKYGPFLKP